MAKGIFMKFKVLILIIAALAVFAGCAHIESGDVTTSEPVTTDLPPQKEAYPVSFENEVFDSSPQTVASLSPALTDILFDLGLSDRLIGVSDYCRKPSEEVKTIGSPAMPDIEAIIGLKPELLVSQSPLASADVIRLKQAGIRTLYIKTPESFEYLCEEYIRLSLIFYGAVDSKDIAVSALSGIDGAMVSAANSGISKRFVIIGAYEDGKYAVMGQKTLVCDIMEVLGDGVYYSEKTEFLGRDEISLLEPDVVIADESIDEDDIEKLFENDPQIVSTDLSVFERPTAAIKDTIEFLMNRLL